MFYIISPFFPFVKATFPIHLSSLFHSARVHSKQCSCRWCCYFL